MIFIKLRRASYIFYGKVTTLRFSSFFMRFCLYDWCKEKHTVYEVSYFFRLKSLILSSLFLWFKYIMKSIFYFKIMFKMFLRKIKVRQRSSVVKISTEQ